MCAGLPFLHEIPVDLFIQAFLNGILDASPPVLPLLTMIRITESTMIELQVRRCAPLESFVFGVRLRLWPVFQRGMQEQADALKRLADGGGGGIAALGLGAVGAGLWGRGGGTTDAVVATVRWAFYFVFGKASRVLNASCRYVSAISACSMPWLR
jgi:hypothetical protein